MTSEETATNVSNGHNDHLYEKKVANATHNDKMQSLPGFWNSEFSPRRKIAFKQFGLIMSLLIIAVFGILSMYWAALWKPNFKGLDFWIVNFDKGIVGQSYVKAFQMADESTMQLSYSFVDPTPFNNDPTLVMNAIYDEQAWGAVVINANASSALTNALAIGNMSYDPNGAIFLQYVEARDRTTIDQDVVPLAKAVLTLAAANFGSNFTKQWLGNNSADTAALQRALMVPQALSNPIGLSEFNIRPFNKSPVAYAAVQIGLIYLIIFTFFVVLFLTPVHEAFVGHLKTTSFFIYRMITPFIFYLFLSLFYTLVSVAFAVPFNDTRYGHGGIPLYWALTYVTMLAVGLALQNVNDIVGQPFTSIFLIFWVISNVSTSFFALQTEAGFFKWGYGFPFYHTIQASTTIIFDLKSHLGLNFGVLLAWVGLSLIIMPFAIWFQLHKSVKVMRGQDEQMEERLDKARQEGRKEVEKRHLVNGVAANGTIG